MKNRAYSVLLAQGLLWGAVVYGMQEEVGKTCIDMTPFLGQSFDDDFLLRDKINLEVTTINSLYTFKELEKCKERLRSFSQKVKMAINSPDLSLLYPLLQNMLIGHLLGDQLEVECLKATKNEKEVASSDEMKKPLKMTIKELLKKYGRKDFCHITLSPDKKKCVVSFKDRSKMWIYHIRRSGSEYLLEKIGTIDTECHFDWKLFKFTPDGKILVTTASSGGIIKLWDTASCRCLDQIREHFTIVKIAVNNSKLAVALEGGVIRLIHMAREKEDVIVDSVGLICDLEKEHKLGDKVRKITFKADDLIIGNWHKKATITYTMPSAETIQKAIEKRKQNSI